MDDIHSRSRTFHGTKRLLRIVGKRHPAAQIPLRWIALGLLIEPQFVVHAVLLPFVDGCQRTDVLGLSLSTQGPFAAWGILAKGTPASEYRSPSWRPPTCATFRAD